MSRRNRKRCPAINNDSTRCARTLNPGDVLCHIHANGPVGATLAAKQAAQAREAATLAGLDALTPADMPVLLKRLTHDPDPAIRLRAIEALLRHEERQTGCPTCSTSSETKREVDALIAKATDAQRSQLRVHLAAISAIKNQIRGIQEEPANGTEQRHTEPTGPSAEVPQPTTDDQAKHIEDVAAEGLSEDTNDVSETPAVRPSEYDALGLVTLPNGTVTHARGDEYAARILSGDIPREDARAMHHDLTAKKNRMFGSLSNLRTI